MNDLIDHRESQRMIYALAHRVKRRLAKIPHTVLSFDDIEQELWIAWCKARDAFEPSRGIPWAAYLQRGMKHHINRVIEKHIERFPEQTFALSLDAPADADDLNNTTLGEIIPSESLTPSEIVEAKSNYEMAISGMSKRAGIFVSLLHEQPQELLNQVLMAQDKAEHAVKLSAPFNAPKRLTTGMVFDLMGAPRCERTSITKEVKKMGVRLSR